jgi:1,4-dihydroxy-2-naphthoate octaprenyltransferase
MSDSALPAHETGQREGALSIWLAAMRPKTLPAAAAPVLLGTGIAWGDGLAHIPSAIVALVGALAIQVGCNFANDYFDSRTGVDGPERLGPVRAVSAGLVTPRAMAFATALALALVVPCVAYLAWRGGWPFVAIGAAAIVLAVAYTGGPFPLAYLGLGDVFVLVFFGPVAVLWTYAAQAQAWSWIPALVGLGPGLLATALICVNNLRDIDGDRAAGKRTLAVKCGAAFARFEYVTCVVAAGALALAVATGVIGSGTARPWALLALVPCAWLAPTCASVLGGLAGRPLNLVLGRTGRALFMYGALMGLGWAVS